MPLRSNPQSSDFGAPSLAGLRNAVVRNQLTSTNQVFFNAFTLEHWGFHRCAERMYVESVKETRRSMRSLRHMTMQGIEPDLIGTPGLYSPARPTVGRDLSEVFRLEQRHAELSLDVLSATIETCEAVGDPTLLDMVRHAARGQGDYVAWLAIQSHSLRELGEAGYRDTQGATLQDGELKTFLDKVKELQAHDLDFPDRPQNAGEIEGSARPLVLRLINDLLAVEVMSTERSFVDAFIFDRRGGQTLTGQTVMDALASMRRAQRITEHILGLGEAPSPGAPSLGDVSPSTGGEIQNFLIAEKRIEEAKISIIHEAESSADLLPSATRSLFAGLLRQYVRRVEWLESVVSGRAGSSAEPSVPPGLFQAMLQRWGVPV